jgi:hypothetical protein
MGARSLSEWSWRPLAFPACTLLRHPDEAESTPVRSLGMPKRIDNG